MIDFLDDFGFLRPEFEQARILLFLGIRPLEDVVGSHFFGIIGEDSFAQLASFIVIRHAFGSQMRQRQNDDAAIGIVFNEVIGQRLIVQIVPDVEFERLRGEAFDVLLDIAIGGLQ